MISCFELPLYTHIDTWTKADIIQTQYCADTRERKTHTHTKSLTTYFTNEVNYFYVIAMYSATINSKKREKV